MYEGMQKGLHALKTSCQPSLEDWVRPDSAITDWSWDERRE